MKKRIFNIIRGVLITVITISLLLGYIWFVFDLNMFAWGTFLIAYAWGDSLFIGRFAGLMIMITVFFSAFVFIYIVMWIDIFLDEKIEKFIVDKQ